MKKRKPIRRTLSRGFSVQKRINEKLDEMEAETGMNRSQILNIALGEFFAKNDPDFAKWFEAWTVTEAA